MPEQPKKSPVLKLPYGAFRNELLALLEKASTELRKKDDGFMAPEVARTLPQFYVVCIIAELLVNGKVVVWKFIAKLAKANQKVVDQEAWVEACSQVNEVLKKLEG
jgi:hypothetical protein